MASWKSLQTRLKAFLKLLAKRWLPIPVQGVFRHGLRQRPSPPRKWVRFGSLRRLAPISSMFGYDRGTPIDRYYIEHFLARHADDVRGHVLEIADNTYTRRFGAGRVSVSDILYVVEGNPRATIIADLQSADHVPSDTFDCIIFTQTLQYIFDAPAAIRTLHRILRPGGVLLATVPGICVFDDDRSATSVQWSFFPASLKRLFTDVFPPHNVTIGCQGNVLAAIALLHGIAVEELSEHELDFHDVRYVVSNTIRAVK